MTETLLMQGYGLVERVEPCACGGFVSALDGDWRHIGASLRLHYLSARHQAYRARNEEADSWPTPGFPFDDLSLTEAGLSAGSQLR